MPHRGGDGLPGDLQFGGDGRPGVPGPVHGEAGEAEFVRDVLQDVVHLGRPVVGAGVRVEGVEEPVLPPQPLDDLHALRLHLDAVGPAGLRPPVLEASVLDSGGVHEVLGVHADQEEGDLEEVDVSLLPGGEVGGEQAAQPVGGQAALRGRLAPDLVVQEWVVLRDAALACVVEHGADVPEVDVPGVLLRRGLGEERVEAVEPSDADVGEGQPFRPGVEGEDPRDGGHVDLGRPRLRPGGGELPEDAEEPVRLPLAGCHLLQDPVADLAGRESVELPPALQVQEDGVDVGLLQFGGDLDGGGLRLERSGVPVGGEEADAGGEVGDRAVLRD